jgi:hypothetical protein
MAVPARRVRAETYDSDFDDDEGFTEDFTLEELSSGERICPPRAASGSMLPALLLILVALGGGYALLRHQPNWQYWLSPVGRNVPGPAAASPKEPALAPANTAAPTDFAAAPPAQLEPAATNEIADAPGEGPKSAASPLTTGALAPAAAPADAPLPPPKTDPTNPYQKRAVAVGLHPELSQVLLKRLSPTDYRNAGTAIQTAVAKTPDNAVFVWPRQRKPELALFEVRFVPGAAPHCRRYVVTVTKDGWSTTAPPMEKCDAPLAARKSG